MYSRLWLIATTFIGYLLGKSLTQESHELNIGAFIGFALGFGSFFFLSVDNHEEDEVEELTTQN